ncbi:hypothetical protein [Actinopolymorpha pittospori]
MNVRLTPPPERGMPAGHHERRRARLVAVVAGKRRRPRRGLLAPIVAAAAVVALSVGGAAGVQLFREAPKPTGSTLAPAGKASDTAGPRPTATSSVLPAPAVLDFPPAEQAQALARCVEPVPSWTGFEPVLGAKVAPRPGAKRWTTWLIAQRDGERLACALAPSGEVSAGLFGGPEAKDIPYLFALVDQREHGAGMYTGPVTRVTAQPDGAKEQDAVLHDGYWFFPTADVEQNHPDANPTAPSNKVTPGSGLIGVGPGYILRGYDASGKVVYDSSKNGPASQDCYTDPAGTEVLVRGAVADPSPGNCRRTLEWTHGADQD